VCVQANEDVTNERFSFQLQAFHSRWEAIIRFDWKWKCLFQVLLYSYMYGDGRTGKSLSISNLHYEPENYVFTALSSSYNRVSICIIIRDGINNIICVTENHKLNNTIRYLFSYIVLACSWRTNCKSDSIYITKLRGFSPQVNYTDRATAACRRS
jgi:hypothetical protein